MAVTTDRGQTFPNEISLAALPAPADPAPLGLAGFALTTFLLSAVNAGFTQGAGVNHGAAWIGYAFAYGGLAQLLAGMWEFRNRNVFGATAFSTYGAFWIGLAIYVVLVAPQNKATGAQVNNDLAWLLLAFAIFNTYMMMWSAFVNKAVFSVFLTLEVTEVVLSFGFFYANTTLIHIGGYIGILTALTAWYTSSAGVINGVTGRIMAPVGAPLSVPARTTQGATP